LADRVHNRSLRVTVTPFARTGENIIAVVEATNVEQTIAELHAPDTIVVSQPHEHALGAGTFTRKVCWRVEYVGSNDPVTVEVRVSSEGLPRLALCKVTK
jgi:hypothetical protein